MNWRKYFSSVAAYLQWCVDKGAEVTLRKGATLQPLSDVGWSIQWPESWGRDNRCGSYYNRVMEKWVLGQYSYGVTPKYLYLGEVDHFFLSMEIRDNMSYWTGGTRDPITHFHGMQIIKVDLWEWCEVG